MKHIEIRTSGDPVLVPVLREFELRGYRLVVTPSVYKCQTGVYVSDSAVVVTDPATGLAISDSFQTETEAIADAVRVLDQTGMDILAA